MSQPAVKSSISLAVITGILPENYREQKCVEEIARNAIGDSSTISFAISFRALPECGVVVFCLRDSGIPPRCDERNWLKRVPYEQMELLVHSKRANPLPSLRPVQMDGLDLWLANEVAHQVLEWTGVFLH